MKVGSLSQIVCLMSALMFGVVACEDEDAEPSSEVQPQDQAVVAHKELCEKGKATYNSETRACECEANSTWNGMACETAIPSSKVEGVNKPEEPKIAPVKEVQPEPQQLTAVSDPHKSAPKTQEGLQDEGDDLSGRCTSAEVKGQWSAKYKTCECPLGKIWDKGGCLERAKLSSASICESQYYRGRWHAKKKFCICGKGKIWINQACRFNYEINDRDACESERGGGRWHDSLNRCICPRLEAWNSKARRCR